MRRVALAFACSCFALLTAAACGHEVAQSNSNTSSGGSSSPNPGNEAPATQGFDRAALLGAIADCAVSTYAEASAKIQSMDEAISAWSAAPADAGARDAARSAYLAAMNAWQVAEVFQFGPLAMSRSPGGEELRDPIYSWPLFARCSVEDYLVQERYAAENFLRISGVNARGMLALEYLLFYEGSANACPAANAMNANGTWDAAQGDMPRRRAAYAKVVSGDLRRRASELVASWGPEGKNFALEFRNAGKGSTVYPSEQMALNAVNLGMFYIEREVKDMKLAWPTNLSGYCTGTSCPEALESQFANVSRDYLISNLSGFKKLLLSCDGSAEGMGFAAYLRAANADVLASRMVQSTEAALSRARDIDDNSLRVAITDGRVRALYDAVKLITDDLKTEFVSTLNLELPQEIQGDND